MDTKWFERRRRILGRMINGKRLPPYVYRFDTRPPAVVRSSGFQPWDTAGTLTLQDHVHGTIQSGPNAGNLSKLVSQWVSTADYRFVKKVDGLFAQQVLNTHLYKISSAAASVSGPFYDVNDFFDKAGQDRPFSKQREWIKTGGIPENAILQFMTGKTYALQLDTKSEAPDEAALTGWQIF